MKIVKLSDNILSPLGLTTEANFDAVIAGRTELTEHTGLLGLPEPFVGSVFDREAIGELFAAESGSPSAWSLFERLCLLSASRALAQAGVDPSDPDVLFVFSTTKGNVDALAADPADPSAYIGASAARMAAHLGNRNTPVVASNACVSGVCAQIAAVRALMSRRCRVAVVVGCDVLSKFIVSGFQSFKALSPERCRPFDAARIGLNLGEAAATMVLAAADTADGRWEYAASANHNDANHISGPSRTGEGSYRVLSDILARIDTSEIALISPHGTATPYNDEMESIALHRAGLSDIPALGLKGYYGHTLGAAGVLETIIAQAAADRGVMPATAGFAACGTTYPVAVAADARPCSGGAIVKFMSGFGGSNAGIAYRKGGCL